MYLINNISFKLAETHESNLDINILNKFSIDDKFILNKIGTINRYISNNKDSSYDLGLDATKLLIHETSPKIDKLDLLVLVTQNPGVNIPHISSRIHQTLKFNSSCQTFDISLGCTGFTQGLDIVMSYLSHNNLNNCILITSDQYSNIIDNNDKSTYLIFSDAASATYISKSKKGFQLIDKAFYLDSSYSTSISTHNKVLNMNGWEVIKFIEMNIKDHIYKILSNNDLTIDDINYFIFHQGSKYILDLIKKILEIPDVKIVYDINETGNTVSSSIPIALKKHILPNIKNNDKILISGFGVGLSIFSNIICYLDE